MLEAEVSDQYVSAETLKQKIKRSGRGVSFFEVAAERVKGKFLSKVYSVAKAERSILCNIEEFVNRNPSQAIEEAREDIKQRRTERISKSKQPGYSFLEELKHFQKNKSLYFEDINQAFITQFKTFCVSYLDMKTRTVSNQLIFIRTLFNEALEEGIVQEKYYPFAGEKEKIRLGSGNKIGLSRDEVEGIEAMELEEGSQIWHTRNVWLTAFYFAGIRITDALNLKWGDFRDGRLYYTMNKNEKPVSFKVPGKAQTILEYYKKPDSGKNDFVFPYLEKADPNDPYDLFVKARNATSLLNGYIKRIAENCGIDKNMSNHIARHSFGNIAGDEIHPLILQLLYRHTDLKTTINYQANFIHKETDEALEKVLNG